MFGEAEGAPWLEWGEDEDSRSLGRLGPVTKTLTLKLLPLVSSPLDIPVVHTGSVDLHDGDLLSQKVEVFFGCFKALFGTFELAGEQLDGLVKRI